MAPQSRKRNHTKNDKITKNHKFFEGNMSHIPQLDDISIQCIKDQAVNCVIKELENNEKTSFDRLNEKILYFKKQAIFYKKLYENCKLHLRKERKIKEMLNLKLFYETNKNSQTNTQNLGERLSTADTTTHKNSMKENTESINFKLCEKLQDNLILFEKLETEILKKDNIIEKQNQTILDQRKMIDNLLKNFDSLVNKQNAHETNVEEISKGIDLINTDINEYTHRLKNFSSNLCNDRLNTINEVNHDTSVDFDLTKSQRSVTVINQSENEVDKKNDRTSFNMERNKELWDGMNQSSMKINELSNTPENEGEEAIELTQSLIASSQSYLFDFKRKKLENCYSNLTENKSEIFGEDCSINKKTFLSTDKEIEDILK